MEIEHLITLSSRLQQKTANNNEKNIITQMRRKNQLGNIFKQFFSEILLKFAKFYHKDKLYRYT